MPSDEVRSAARQASIERGDDAAIFCADDFDAWVALRQFRQELTSSVCRSVIDYEDAEIPKRLLQDRSDRTYNGSLSVICWNEKRRSHVTKLRKQQCYHWHANALLQSPGDS
jgi:hypothetical protein